MWSSLLLADAGSDPVLFSGVSIIPAEDPILLFDTVERADVDHVLIVAPRSLIRPLRLGVSITVGRRPDIAVTWMISEHAPLAILSALALARTATDEPAIGVDLVRQLLARSWSGAWSHSVAKLAEPSPRLSQHLRSLLPGSGFLIRQSPLPAVLSQPRTDDVPSAGIDRVLLVQDGAVPPPLAKRLSGAAGVSAVRQVALPGRWRSVYGTDRTGQLALLPADAHALIEPADQRCPSCLLIQSTAVCPYCRVLNQSAERTAPIALPVQVGSDQPAATTSQMSLSAIRGDRFRSTNSGGPA
jgi:hypothetical protein